MTATPRLAPDRRTAWLAVGALAPLLLAAGALAQTTLYWDLNGATAGAGGPSPSGIWDTATANWSASSAGTLSTVVWTPGSSAIFSAGTDATGGYTITLSGTQTAGGVSFKDGTPTLTGGTLSLEAGSLISVGIGKSATIALTLAGSGSWTNSAAGGTLTLTGANTIAGPLTLLGGKISFDSDSAAGTGAIVVSPGNDVFIQNAVASTTLTNPITLNPQHNVDISALSGTLTLNGSIGGTRTLCTVGGQAANTVVLGASNSFGANVEVQSGTLIVKADAALGDTSGNTTIDSGATLGVQGGFTYGASESVILSGNGVGNLGSMRSLSGVNIFKGPLTLQTSTTIGVDVDSLELTRGISGVGLGITKVASGRLILSGSPNNYGATTIAGGSVRVDTTLGTGAVTVNSGTTLAGDGTVPGSVALSGTISPGGSPGELTTGDETWNGDASYIWEINDADFGSAGAGLGVGWDLVNISGGLGTLNIAATPAQPFTIHLLTLDPVSGNPAPAQDFENSNEYTFTIAHTTGGITGFDPAAFVLDTANFQNPLGNGVFLIQQSGNDLVLRFVQKPSITLQPVDQLGKQCGIDSATFSVTATGSGTLDYQWYEGATPVGTDSPTLAFSPVSFALAGTYHVVVTNLYGTATSSDATLGVQDTVKPVLTACPADILLSGAGPTTVTYTPPTANDACDGPLTVICDHPSGSLFSVGTTLVTCTATDSHGNSQSCTFNVTVCAPGAPAVYVDANYMGKPNGMVVKFPDGGAGADHVIGCDAFATIQAGVNAVAASGTVNVAAGTYDESQVLLAQACTLQGQGAATTIIDAGCGTGLLLPGTIRITAPGNVTVDGFTVKNPKSETVSGQNVRVGIYASAPWPTNVYTIQNNIILGCNNPADPQDYGFYAYNGQGSVLFRTNQIHLVSANPILIERHPGPTEVSDNTFDRGVADAANDAYFNMNYGGADVTSLQKVQHNTIDMGNDAGPFDADHRGVAITFAGAYTSADQGAYSQVVITENQVINLRGYRRGVGLWNNAPSANPAWGDITGAVIERNVLSGPATPEPGSIGIRLLGQISNAGIRNNALAGLDESFQARNWNTTVASDTVIFDNSFTNIATGFENQGLSPLNASGNWWDGNTEAGITAKLIGPADYTPWLDAATDTDPITIGFQGDFHTLHVSATSPQTGATGRIQEGINLTSGSTVILEAGTYIENVLANKDNLELAGVGQGLVTLVPAISSPNCGGGPGGSLCPGASSIILVRGNNVKIHVLTLDGDNPGLTSGVIAGGHDLDARNGIITDHTLGVFNGLEVYNVTVQNIYLRGIYASSGGTFNFHNNTVHNVQADPASIAMFNFGGSGSFASNNVSDAGDAISANWSTGTTFQSNTITSSGSGVHTDNSSGPDLLQGNNVSAMMPGAYGLFVFAPYGSITVSGNSVSDCNVGLALSGQGAATSPLFINNNVTAGTGPNNIGIYETTWLFGFGYTDVSGRFQGNSVQNTVYGFYGETPYNTNDLAAAITANNVITGNQYGVFVTGSRAKVKVEHDDLRNNSVGIHADGAAVVDAGNCTPTDVTGLGQSAGGNNLTGYGFDSAAPWAIENANTSGPDLLAYQNSFGAVLGDDIRTLLVQTSPVKFTQSGGLLVKCPADLTVQCIGAVPSPASDLATFLTQLGSMVSAGDITTLTVADNPPLGSYPVHGAITRTYTLTDACGETATCQQTITVNDTTPPTITAPANLTDVPADAGQCFATGVNLGSPTAADNCGSVTTSNNAPAQFPIGTTIVTWTATDASGNQTPATQLVTVIDNQPPTIACPANIVQGVDTGQNHATVTFSVTASDNCTNVTVTTTPFNSGDPFPVGTNTVTATARDAAGNTSQCSFTVAVIALPAISSQPESRTNNAGTTAAFTVLAASPAPITYQWYKNGTVALSDGGNVSGSTSDVLSLANVLGADRGAYTVVVRNLAGAVTSAPPAVLTVLDPIILAQPASVSNNLGSAVSFSVSAFGTTPLRYQWQQGGLVLPGATSSTYSIASIRDSDAGNYTVVVTNVAGAITSAPALLYIFHPPVFVSQPTNENVVLEHSAIFDVSVNGSLPFSYQWQKNNADIPGATTRTFTIPAVAVADAGLYRVVVTNVDGSATSSNATLNVIVPPAITSQPVSLTNDAGATAFFAVTNTGDPSAYRWFKDGTNALSDAGKLSGVATPVLTISNVLGADTAAYSVVISNAGGVVTSSNAFLVVIDPIITNPPASTTNNLGSPAGFSVGAYGTSPEYQWRKDGTPIAGATASSYAIAAVMDADAGTYTVVVSNAFGVLTSAPPAILTVVDPPIITNPPVSITRNAGQTAVFSVGASGTAPNYLWKKNHAPLSDGGNISGSATATLTLSDVSDSDVASYTVVVSNPAGTQTSSPATLTVIDPPVITQQPASRTNDATTTATFTVLASGTAPGYHWYKNGTNLLVDGGKISGSTSNVLSIANVLGADRGAYTVVLSNPAGTVTSAPPATLTVIDPFITSQPMSVTNAEGSTATFSVTAVGTTPLHYQWRFDGVDIPGESNSTLVLDNIADSDSGNYVVVVTNVSGSATSAPAFLQAFPPLIVDQPASQIAFPGENVSFSVGVNGQTPFSYQWQREGTNIAGATARILSLPDVAFSDAGSYRVIVSNPLGTQISADASLLVTDLPWLDIVKQPAGNAIVTVHGLPGSNTVLQATTDFVDWVSLTTNVVTYSFTDTNAPAIPYRFYRAYYLP